MLFFPLTYFFSMFFCNWLRKGKKDESDLNSSLYTHIHMYISNQVVEEERRRRKNIHQMKSYFISHILTYWSYHHHHSLELTKYLFTIQWKRFYKRFFPSWNKSIQMLIDELVDMFADDDDDDDDHVNEQFLEITTRRSRIHIWFSWSVL